MKDYKKPEVEVIELITEVIANQGVTGPSVGDSEDYSL